MPPLKESRGASLRYASRAHDNPTVLPKAAPSSSSQDDPVVYTLQNNLSRFARSNNRNLILQTFHNSKYLECVPIDSFLSKIPKSDRLEEMELMVDTNSLILNDHEVCTTKSMPLTVLLRSLVEQLCEGIPDDPDITYHTLLSRLTDSSDAYASLNGLLGSSDIILKQAHEAKRPPPPAVPTLDIYQANGVIHCRIVQVVYLALFRKSDLAVNKPWMWLTCTVHERFNFGTHECTRQAKLEAPQF